MGRHPICHHNRLRKMQMEPGPWAFSAVQIHSVHFSPIHFDPTQEIFMEHFFFSGIILGSGPAEKKISLKMDSLALASVDQLVEYHPMYWKVSGSVPGWFAYGRRSVDVSLTLTSLPPSVPVCLLLSSSLSKISKNTLKIRNKNDHFFAFR